LKAYPISVEQKHVKVRKKGTHSSRRIAVKHFFIYLVFLMALCNCSTVV